MKKQFRDFESAREFAKSLGLKNNKEWREYCKSGNKSDNIPASPDKTYKNEFKGYGDWLGTGNTRDKQFLSFKEAREFTQSLELKNYKEWAEYCKSGNKPDDIPTSPDNNYKKDFKGYGDFLGTGRIATKDRAFRPFAEAREFVRGLGLKNNTEWRVYCKSGNKPDDIPTAVEVVYKNEWKGAGDFFGTGIISRKDRVYRPFAEAREFAIMLNFKNRNEWEKYCKSNTLPTNSSSRPNYVYKKEWKGWGDFLGTGNIQLQQIQYRSFNDARKFIHTLNLKTSVELNDFVKSKNMPKDVPSSPEHVYKNKGWKSMGDWLGTGTVAPQLKVYRPYKEAREFVRSLNLKGFKEWNDYCKSGKKPDDIPAAPWNVYKEWKKK
jgi:hypothetical protein